MKQLRLVLAALPALAGSLLLAQEAPPLTFDVVSIRLQESTQVPIRIPSSSIPLRGDTYSEPFAHVGDLMMDAYEVRPYQIMNLPEWTRSTVFAVTAKSDRMPTLAQAREMIRSMLADRFGLRIRRETRNIPAYALTVGRQGVKLQRQPNGLPIATHMTLLAGVVDRPLLDETGLEGMWGLIPLDWAGIRRSSEVTGDGGVSVFTEVEDKWGLKLEPRSHSAEVLIVEAVQRPSEN